MFLETTFLCTIMVQPHPAKHLVQPMEHHNHQLEQPHHLKQIDPKVEQEVVPCCMHNLGEIDSALI